MMDILTEIDFTKDVCVINGLTERTLLNWRVSSNVVHAVHMELKSFDLSFHRKNQVPKGVPLLLKLTSHSYKLSPV